MLKLQNIYMIKNILIQNKAIILLYYKLAKIHAIGYKKKNWHNIRQHMSFKHSCC